MNERNPTDVAIHVHNVGKVFKLPHEKTTSIKTAFINAYRRKPTYEKQSAIKGISFDIKHGEFFGIIGRNGSGKSTLLKMLAGIYEPTEGVVKINGQLTPFIELGVGFNPELTGRENVFLNGALLGFSRKEMTAMYDDIVDFAEIKRFMDQKLKNYSSGMQVRLAFSIAIRAKSDILLIDEVLAVGDQSFQEKCYKVFDDIKESGRTIVFISHDSSAIERFCDRVAIIDRGVLVDLGDPRSMVLKYGALVAGEQYVSQQRESEGQVVHQGSGAISVGRVSVLDKNGLSKPSINSGEPFTIEVKYKLNKKINGPVVIGVGIIDDQGVSILGPNTNESKRKVIINRNGTVKAAFNSNPLAPKTYTITVGFFNETSTLAYDLVEEAARFKVIGEERHGKIYIEPRWSFNQTT